PGVTALQPGEVGVYLYLAPLFQKFSAQRFIVLDRQVACSKLTQNHLLTIAVRAEQSSQPAGGAEKSHAFSGHERFFDLCNERPFVAVLGRKLVQRTFIRRGGEQGWEKNRFLHGLMVLIPKKPEEF